MEKHPLITVYGKTSNASFPLILFVGREPDYPAPIAGGIGTYDFREPPNCGVWNTAYSLVGEICDCADLKGYCEKKKSSIIVFTNISPRSLENKIRNKTKERLKVTPEEFKKHIEKIFSFRDLLARVRLIVLSGHKTPGFEFASHFFKEMCKKNHKQSFEVEFLDFRNSKKLREQFKNNRIRKKIKRAYEEWKRQF